LEIWNAEATGTLFVSSVTAWEAGVAALKTNPAKRPNLLNLTADQWFKYGVRRIGARTLPIDFKIAVEASSVSADYGSGDPGDCFLIATARVRRLTLATRDRRIEELSKLKPGYLNILKC